MNKQSKAQQAKYRSTCSHYRFGGTVKTIQGKVVFHGSFNAAKLYVRTKGLKSYSVGVQSS